jgi:hypothetical protein
MRVAVIDRASDGLDQITNTARGRRESDWFKWVLRRKYLEKAKEFVAPAPRSFR